MTETRIDQVKNALTAAENQLLHRAVDRERADADLFGATLCDLAKAGVVDIDCPAITDGAPE